VRLDTPNGATTVRRVIDERFSAEVFESLRTREERVALEKALQAEIAAEIAPSIRETLAAVVSQLNQLGHSLAETRIRSASMTGIAPRRRFGSAFASIRP
jgi:hypothetical protein